MKTALAVIVFATACSERGVSLAELGPIDMQVNVNVGTPVRPQSGDGLPRLLYATFEQLTGCPTLANVDEAVLDDTDATAIESGGMEHGTNHGKEESYCVEPVFYFDELPAARPRSTIRIADDSTALMLEVDRLLVNPRITVETPLRPGAVARLAVDDPRPIASATVWWRDAVLDEQRVEWQFTADVSTPGEIRFTVPVDTRQAGTLGVEITITDHQMACTGFASCSITARGGASFPLTTVP